MVPSLRQCLHIYSHGHWQSTSPHNYLTISYVPWVSPIGQPLENRNSNTEIHLSDSWCETLPVRGGEDFARDLRGGGEGPTLTLAISVLLAHAARHLRPHDTSPVHCIDIDMTVQTRHYGRLLYYTPCHCALQTSLHLGQMVTEGLLV